MPTSRSRTDEAIVARRGDPTFRDCRYEYFEWIYTVRGVPWRMGGSVLREFEAMEQRGWRVLLSWDTGIVLRRKRPTKRRARRRGPRPTPPVRATTTGQV